MVVPGPQRSILGPCLADTGRIVGTGCQGAMGARLAIARAQRQLSDEAGVHLHIREFAVINTARSQLEPLMMFCGPESADPLCVQLLCTGGGGIVARDAQLRGVRRRAPRRVAL